MPHGSQNRHIWRKRHIWRDYGDSLKFTKRTDLHFRNFLKHHIPPIFDVRNTIMIFSNSVVHVVFEIFASQKHRHKTILAMFFRNNISKTTRTTEFEYIIISVWLYYTLKVYILYFWWLKYNIIYLYFQKYKYIILYFRFLKYNIYIILIL